MISARRGGGMRPHSTTAAGHAAEKRRGKLGGPLEWVRRASAAQRGMLVVAATLLLVVLSGSGLLGSTRSQTFAELGPALRSGRALARMSPTEREALAAEADVEAAMEEGQAELEREREARTDTADLGNTYGFPEPDEDQEPDMASEDGDDDNMGGGETNGGDVGEHDRAAAKAPERLSLEELVSAPFPDLGSMKNEDLFENAADLAEAPEVFVPSFPQKRNEWWAVQNYVRLYSMNPIKRFVPVLKRHIQINQESFTQKFRKFGRPLLFRFENMRKAGFMMRSYTFDELQTMFPYDKTMDGRTFSQYRPNAKIESEEIDLGPGLAAIANDGQIVRKNGLRNFPRNMKVKTDSLRRLGVEWPPLMPSRWRQRPSLWMGTSTSGTAFHSDCCDNFIAMIAGTKRITLAPPSDFHLLTPRCVGKNKGLCYANIPEPNKPGVSSSHYNKMIVDVKPGEILYVPSGWFHHIENLGPTLMTNFWTFGKETCGVVSTSPRFY